MMDFLRTPVPFYIVILLLAVVVSASAFSIVYFGRVIYEYQFMLPSGSAGEAARPLVYGAWPALTNADFFRSVRDRFVAEKTNFIEADLTTMRLTVWQNGNAALTVPILTKGRPGSWWETPAGLYRIDGKEKEHFSRFAGVYMPWSLPFQGNFFIHGWPYYPDGTPVESQYSGGCIRLSTDDAAQVYGLASVGMPVLVSDRDFESDNVTYALKAPSVSAREYLVADLKSNFVLMEKDPRVVASIASVTKLVTALVATEYINLDTDILITKSMIVPTSKPRLRPGQYVSAIDLLYPLLEESSNEAAEALAQTIGRDRFIQLMNDKAAALGMTQTRFSDPSGSSADNASSAEDLFNLLKYIENNRSFILSLTTGRVEETDYGQPRYRDLENFNAFSDRSDFL
ncbi:MAG TPA: L,D-transpeptidase family protein, partial [Candidatus Paceibacterota bacterium]|nr:L,D-transpeptidase family protein [Candidatus Paceibacterota bacterium]